MERYADVPQRQELITKNMADAQAKSGGLQTWPHNHAKRLVVQTD
jgi:hypothetical protein